LAFLFSGEEHFQQDKLAKLLATSDNALNEFSQQLMGDEPTFKEFFSECTALYHFLPY
jgi:hypothetical protein